MSAPPSDHDLSDIPSDVVNAEGTANRYKYWIVTVWPHLGVDVPHEEAATVAADALHTACTGALLRRT